MYLQFVIGPRPRHTAIVRHLPIIFTLCFLPESPAFAQFAAGPPVLPALSESPFLERWLLEAPLAPIGVLLVVGLVVAWNFRHSSPRRGLVALGAAAVLALGLWALASAVETDRERVTARSVALIDAVAAADAEAAGLQLDTRILARSRWFREGFPRDRLLNEIGSAFGGQAEVNAHSIKETRAGLNPDGSATVLVRVLVTPESTQIPVGTWWRLDFVQRPTEAAQPADDRGWRIIGIEPLWFAGFGDVSSSNR